MIGIVFASSWELLRIAFVASCYCSSSSGRADSSNVNAEMMRHSDEQESDVRTFISEIRQYATITELDETVLHRLISKILIGEVRKVDGQKVQEVKIVYNFVGEIPEIEE